jgi:hypothetical protein
MAEPRQQLDADSEAQRCAMIADLWQEQLSSSSMRPTAATFRAAVRALAHLGEHERLLAAVDAMVERDLFCAPAELQLAVNACVALQSTAKLLELLALPVLPSAAQAQLYSHVLQLCKEQGKVSMATQLQRHRAAALPDTAH